MDRAAVCSISQVLTWCLDVHTNIYFASNEGPLPVKAEPVNIDEWFLLYLDKKESNFVNAAPQIN